MGDRPTGWVDLYWLPLGAGGHVVRGNGRVYERLAARQHHRAAMDLYHAGLMLHSGGITYAIEMGPVWNISADDRGVVREGPVGARWLGRLRVFRYEVRCWAGGLIPDIADAVDSPVRTTDDPERADDVLRMLREAPPLTWGRDELRTGEMWNSNSLVAWVLGRTGHDMRQIVPPRGGRAPGWNAGLVLADRQLMGLDWSTGSAHHQAEGARCRAVSSHRLIRSQGAGAGADTMPHAGHPPTPHLD